MATVKLSVPDELIQAFDATFDGQDESATIAELIRQAMKGAERGRNPAAAVARQSAGRKKRPIVDDEIIGRARESGRA